MRRPPPKKTKWWHLSREEVFRLIALLPALLSLLLHW